MFEKKDTASFSRSHEDLASLSGSWIKY